MSPKAKQIVNGILTANGVGFALMLLTAFAARAFAVLNRTSDRTRRSRYS